MNIITIFWIQNNQKWDQIIANLLFSLEDIVIVETAQTIEQAKSFMENSVFDILLLDLDLNVLKLEQINHILKAIHEGTFKTIVVLPEDNAEWVSDAFLAGASNVISQSQYFDLPNVIREVSKVEYQCMHPISLKLLRSEMKRLKQIEGIWFLTRSEREILELINHGYSRKQVMAHLHVSESAVKTHVFHAIKKMKVKNGKEAAALAKRKGWIH